VTLYSTFCHVRATSVNIRTSSSLYIAIFFGLVDHRQVQVVMRNLLPTPKQQALFQRKHSGQPHTKPKENQQSSKARAWQLHKNPHNLQLVQGNYIRKSE
jgi:hypothetical protein